MPMAKGNYWTKRRAREELCERLGEHRLVWVTCHRITKLELFCVDVWEEAPPGDAGPPVHLGRGCRSDRSGAIRAAVEDALARLRYADPEQLEQLAHDWIKGFRHGVLCDLRKMTGFVAAAAALAISARLPDSHRSGFVAAVEQAGKDMAPKREF
jgi:hypothetical protein